MPPTLDVHVAVQTGAHLLRDDRPRCHRDVLTSRLNRLCGDLDRCFGVSRIASEIDHETPVSGVRNGFGAKATDLGPNKQSFYGSIINRLSPVMCLLKLTPRTLILTPSLVPGGA